jgi:hypothetical protein
METIIRNVLKGGKPSRKPYHKYCFRNLFKKLIFEENSILFMNSIVYNGKNLKAEKS